MIKIRKADSEDLLLTFTFVKELLIELGDEAKDLEKVNKLQDSKTDINNLEAHFVFFAEDGGKAVGIITLSECFAVYTGGNYGIINEMYVLPEYRSKNIGTLLINKAKEIAIERKWGRIDVTTPVEKKWERTKSFYLKHNFEFTGEKLKFDL